MEITTLLNANLEIYMHLDEIVFFFLLAPEALTLTNGFL